MLSLDHIVTQYVRKFSHFFPFMFHRKETYLTMFLHFLICLGLGLPFACVYLPLSYFLVSLSHWCRSFWRGKIVSDHHLISS